MSIRDEIANRVGDGRLFCLPPLIPSGTMVRAMFVSEEINQVVHPPWEATKEGLRLSRLRAYLDTWTEGVLVSVAEAPYHKPRNTFLARVDPVADDVFDIRCFDPKPGIRVLGCFSEKDVFVALTWNHRENLGGPDSRGWRDEIERCKASWRRLFHPYPPFRGANLDAYLSNFIAV